MSSQVTLACVSLFGRMLFSAYTLSVLSHQEHDWQNYGKGTDVAGDLAAIMRHEYELLLHLSRVSQAGSPCFLCVHKGEMS